MPGSRRLLLLASVSLIACGEPTPPSSIFLIVVDTLRADRVAGDSETRQPTPNLDRLAALGTVFTNAHASASWTVPSMGALLTSRHPTQLRLVERSDGRLEHAEHPHRAQLAYEPPAQVTMLAEALRDAGLHTAAFVDQPGLSSSGFLRGFEERFLPNPRNRIRRYSDEQELPRHNWPRSMQHSHRIDRALVGSFRRWLAKGKHRPVFAWIHLLTPHRPYLSRPRGEAQAANASPAELYDAEVRAADALVGEILDAIEDSVGLTSAHIAFTSDHGEGFDEHGIDEHGNSMHYELLHVPLILASPALPRGTHSERLISSLDLMPTLLELAGVTTMPEGLEGRSFAGAGREPDPERTVYSEGVLYGETQRSLISQGYKLIESSSGLELFDTTRDPEERVDLADREPERTRELHDEMRALHERLLRDAEALGGEPVSLSDPEQRATRDALRALGYLE